MFHKLLSHFVRKIKIPIFTSKVVGNIGEAAINSMLKELDPSKFILVNNITIPNPKARSKISQIDHIVISKTGIFVLETKNYTGWIFGSPQNQYWTQVVYKKKNKLYNPIKQNWGHIYALSDYLNIPRIKFYNLVCFIGDAKFKTDIPLGVYTDRSFIRDIEVKAKEVLTIEDIEKIKGLLIPNKTES